MGLSLLAILGISVSVEPLFLFPAHDESAETHSRLQRQDPLQASCLQEMASRSCHLCERFLASNSNCLSSTANQMVGALWYVRESHRVQHRRNGVDEYPYVARTK
ncbi:hypothetical protein EDB92DRAFT_1836202 [Lactarius akahatsu]|uniref:Secreted protein n=1 Tax=Lactarius akahatsu TaxID=416441 RepID=A0AAD4LMV7_9AGAM|nr:hypothetical protein EDB92DRAFT_1836202 [Lactarius akahatsu]